MKLLLIEDDPDLREVIQTSLQRERCVVEVARDYREAVSKLFIYQYDCILIDIMLPDGNGLDLLREMQRRGIKHNVIIISARDAIEDKVEGLELGADDYLAKPFHLAELKARIRSVIRRSQRAGECLIRLGNVEIDPAHFSVEVEGRAIEMLRKEYDILAYLIVRPNRLISKETLAESIWGDSIDQADNFDFVYAQIKNVRKKLREAGASIEIKTVYGLGYKLVTL
ncbi:MAG: response regulator transcription factor [Prevotellaceae bacterium]|jgi:DNA-binding response OmpR family regulator|nr:response regulator transcription factor [Prevotellaceae bacterium]